MPSRTLIIAVLPLAAAMSAQRRPALARREMFGAAAAWTFAGAPAFAADDAAAAPAPADVLHPRENKYGDTPRRASKGKYASQAPAPPPPPAVEPPAAVAEAIAADPEYKTGKGAFQCFVGSGAGTRFEFG